MICNLRRTKTSIHEQALYFSLIVSADCKYYDVDAVFMEVHDHPELAPSDGPNMLPLERLGPLLLMLRDIHALVRRGQVTQQAAG